ncbi:hypothetical protein FK531_13285 [Rhodococcus spelaei]|uniref:MarR family transcriptional regulator n=1 Tax=Rhodococcus spelaei TaxID=2546320 RepID=A0A541B8X7_9NOCA|nr:hypothetical protein [Rhodococcus spelaei]TQF68766.1 hypothetical protein FK531_13285 [Rhodococcus spelaei]
MAFAGNVDELALLQSVRLKGAVTADVLARQLGVAATSAQAALDALVAAGRAADTGDGAFSLTEAGVAELDDQLDAERVSIDEDLFAEVVDRFEPLDAEFADAAGDAGKLADLDRRASDVFDDVSAYVPRLARYQELLADSVTDGTAYAVVWSELRQEILSAAGR